jgi:hypothetical protein
MAYQELADAIAQRIEQHGVVPSPSTLTDQQCAAIRKEAAKEDGLGHGYFVTNPTTALNIVTRQQVASLLIRYRRTHAPYQVRGFVPREIARVPGTPRQPSAWVRPEDDPATAEQHGRARLLGHITQGVRLHGASLVAYTNLTWDDVAAEAHAAVDAVCTNMKQREARVAPDRQKVA